MSKAPVVFCLVSFLAAIEASAQPPDQLRFELPMLIVSAGQSADVQLASVLARRAQLPATLSKAGAEKELSGHKTLVLVIGASMKGLGSAGLDAGKERTRVDRLLAEARQENIPVIALHLGGESRRGQLTDELLSAYLPSARLAIVVKSGNKDGLFTRICKEKNIPLIEVDKTADAQGPLAAAFRK
jgi:hypothetical protein